MQHLDWFYPEYYHQTSSQQMRTHVSKANLKIEVLGERVNGITVVAIR
jgi:hypothetical protein